MRRAVSANLKPAIEGLTLERPPLPISSIYRQIKRFAPSTGESTPSYWTVYRMVRDLPEGPLALAHRGNKARIVTQIERVLDVNRLNIVSTEVVEAARDSLVIGHG
ncbi:MAG: hypothetical protein ABSD75_31845 [Terriglobales bacterium]